MALLNDILADLSSFFGLEPPPADSKSQGEEVSLREAAGADISPEKVNNLEEVALIKPDSFSEVQRIVDDLREETAIIVNLEDLSGEEAARIVDFVSGAVYALNGDTEKLEEKIFLFTPPQIKISYGEEGER